MNRFRPLLGAAPAVALVALLTASSAAAAWNADGSGRGYSKASSLPAVAAPTASSSGRNVTVSWTAPGGPTPVSGYVVKRYDSSNVEETVLAGCSGTVAGTSCTETAVPTGTWRYSVTALRGNWRGAESAKSADVTVAGPSLTLDTTTVNSLPTTLDGEISQFAAGQLVVFRLDDPTSGTILGGSITPGTIPLIGSADVSVTIPAGTSNGSHTVFAIGSSGDQASAAITVARPQITTSVIAKASGGDPGFIGRNVPYYVYANVTGSGGPPAGLASLTANVASVTPGTTTAPMSFGSFTAGGQAYDYRSAQLVAGGSITAGAKSYTLTATDSGGTTQTAGFSVTADITAPSASNVQTTNVTGGTAGLAQAGDRLTLTYSEQIEANSILAGWSGASTPVVVRLNNGSPDSVTIFNATNAAQLPLGTVNMGRTDHTTANLTFGATGTASTMVRSGAAITITLGTQSAAATTAAGTGTMSWIPSATATDRAGNASTTTARSESGTADVDF